MKNKNILIDETEQNAYSSEYYELNKSFTGCVEGKIYELNSKFNTKATYYFDITDDFKDRNMNIMISHLHDSYDLNLFNFMIKIDKFDDEIKKYILHDNILQLACIKDADNKVLLDLKDDISKEIDSISKKMDGKVIFNMLTKISIYEPDYINNNESLIKIHFERCMTSNKKTLDTLLNDFSLKYKCSIIYISNEIIFGSYLKNNLNEKEFNDIKIIRDKYQMNMAIFYSDIKDIGLRDKLYQTIHPHNFFKDAIAFGFNNV